MTQTSNEARALPGPVSAIRLTYHHQQGWWDTSEDEPEIWHVSVDLVDDELGETIEHVGDLEFFRADPYETPDLFGVLDGHDGDVGMIAGVLLDHSTGHFRDDLDDVAESLGSGMLILNRARLAAPWRGFGMGVVLAGKAIKRLGFGCRSAACYPAPSIPPPTMTRMPGSERSPPSAAPGNNSASVPTTTTSTSWISAPSPSETPCPS